ncbi:hypothetical protein GGR57DRAFT_513972 [Xylariaceae sp. FL1272]|nr:hypothetical protein GGR57DRAFT_513972 [Xylariaceae sp. FL1272]
MPIRRKNGKRVESLTQGAQAELDRWIEEDRAERAALNQIRAVDHLFAKPSDYDKFESKSPREDEYLAPIASPATTSSTIESATQRPIAALTSHDATGRSQAFVSNGGSLSHSFAKPSAYVAPEYTSGVNSQHSSTTSPALTSNMKAAVSSSSIETGERPTPLVGYEESLERWISRSSSPIDTDEHPAPFVSYEESLERWISNSSPSNVPEYSSTVTSRLSAISTPTPSGLDKSSIGNETLSGNLPRSPGTTALAVASPLGKRYRLVFDEHYDQDNDNSSVHTPPSSEAQSANWSKRVTSNVSRDLLDGDFSDRPTAKKQKTSNIPRRMPSFSAMNNPTGQGSDDDSDEVQYLYANPVERRRDDLGRNRPINTTKPANNTGLVSHAKPVKPTNVVSSANPHCVTSRRHQARQQTPIGNVENSNSHLHVEGSFTNVIEASTRGRISLCGERPWRMQDVNGSWD